MYSELLQQLDLGANGLPYVIPIHPNLVHLTLGLFIIGIAFDIVGVFFVFEKPLFKYLAIPATRSNLFDVGWYNMLAAAIVTFFTVAAGFYEIMLVDSPPEIDSAWGLSAIETMLWHGVMFLMYLHGTLGAQLAAEFGVHNTAGHLIRLGQDPNTLLR